MSGRKSHQTLRRMVYFAAIADAGSIRGAARALRLSVPVISAALTELEEELGTVLAVRTTRTFKLTDTGRRVQEAASSMLELVAEVQHLSQGGQPLNGTLSLTIPQELAAHWLPPILAAYRRAHPEVSISVDANDTIISIRDSEHDMALRILKMTDRETRLAVNGAAGIIALACVTAPGVEPRIEAGRVFVPLPLLAMDPGQDRLTARLGASGEIIDVRFEGSMLVRSRAAAREMVRHGIGAALLLDLGLDSTYRTVLEGADFGKARLELALRDRFPTPELRAFLAIQGEFGSCAQSQ